MAQKTYGYGELQAVLNVKAPLLMLDSASVSLEENKAEAIKAVSMNETVFQGHFPGVPVLPGVLQVGAMEQLSRLLYMELHPGSETPVLKGLRKVKFRTPVKPGDIITMSCQPGEILDGGDAEFQVKLMTGGGLASSGFIKLGARPEGCYSNFSAADVPAAPAEYTIGPIEIMKHIPHRYPFMLVDGAAGLDNPAEIYGFKNITGSDPLVQAVPSMEFSGYLAIEAGAQLGCASMLSQPENKGMLGFFMSIDTAEFIRPLIPGMRLDFKISCESRGKFGLATGVFSVGGNKVINTEIKFALVENNA